MSVKNLIFLIMLVFPTAVCAEPQILECNIRFGDFVDVYTIEVDVDKNLVTSTYHAASNKDNSVTLDYRVSSNAIIYDEKVIYRSSSRSLDYTYEINRKTLEIIRYVDDASETEVGRGPCNIVASSGKTLLK